MMIKPLTENITTEIITAADMDIFKFDISKCKKKFLSFNVSNKQNPLLYETYKNYFRPSFIVKHNVKETISRTNGTI